MAYDVELSRQRRREQEEQDRERQRDFELRAELNAAWEIWKHLCPADFDPNCGPGSAVREEYWPAIAGHMVTWMKELRSRGLLERLDHLDSFEISDERREAIKVYRMAAEGDVPALATHLRTIGYEWDRDFWVEFKKEWRAFVPRDLIDPPARPETEVPSPPTSPQTVARRSGDQPTEADRIVGRSVLRTFMTVNFSKRTFASAFRATGAKGSNKMLGILADQLKAERRRCRCRGTLDSGIRVPTTHRRR
jgi:hypothetical protein